MMQTVDKGDQQLQLSRDTKGKCKQPCARLSDVYQKEDVKNAIKRAFESRSSYNHGTGTLSAAYHAIQSCMIHYRNV